jgi:hypothetical protein
MLCPQNAAFGQISGRMKKPENVVSGLFGHAAAADQQTAIRIGLY